MKKHRHKSSPNTQSTVYILNSIKEHNNAYKHVHMPHMVSLAVFYTKEILEMTEWCAATFTDGTWRCSESFPGNMHFLREQDALMFTLRWTKF